MTCRECGDVGWVTVAVHGCSGNDRECAEMCPVPAQAPCPSCRPTPEPQPVSDEEPF